MTAVLILDANQRSALATTRSLGRRGVDIITADETEDSLAGSSRYARLHLQHPSARLRSEAFIDFLVTHCEHHRIGMIMPMTELTTTLLLQHRAILPELILPLAEFDSIELLSDKCRLMHLARSRSIPVPPGTEHAPFDDACDDELPDDGQYPLVLKPGKSWLLTDAGWIHSTVRFAASAQEARDILRQDQAFHHHPYLRQKCVDGHGEGVFALYDHGKAIAFFSHRRLREKPPSGGVSVLSESVALDATLLKHARKLLDAANWHGIAMVEFRVDDAGNVFLMEVNTRFWGSLQLAIDAGVDFPWLLYQLSCGHSVATVEHYRTGRRLRWLLGDLDSLYLTLRDARYTASDKARAMLHFLWPHPFITRHEVNRWSDMKPFWWELKRYLKDLI